MTDSLDFEQLKKTWQESPAQPLPALDTLIRSRTNWIWVLTLFDVIATIAVALLIFWWLVHQEQPTDYFFVTFLGALTVLGWVVVLYIRRGTWQLESQATPAMLDLLIRRCRASINLARLNLWCIGLGLLVGIVIRIWLKPNLEIPGLEIDDSNRWPVRIGVLFAAGIWGLSAEWYRRRKTRELKRLRDMRQQLLDS